MRPSHGLERHSVFTVTAAVRAGAVADTERALAEVAADLEGNRHLPFGRLPRLHFASLVLFPADARFPATLVFESNVDGGIADYLDRVVEVAGAGADALWGGCLGYPEAGSTDTAGLRRWLQEHVVLPGAYHVGTTGRSREQIALEADLREALGRRLDGDQDAGSLPPTPREIRSALQTLVGEDPSLSWALQPPDSGGFVQSLRQLVHAARSADTTVVAPAVSALGLLALLARRRPLAALLAVGALPAWLWWLEGRDQPVDRPVADDVLTTIERCEDRRGVLQNHLASLTHVKPSAGRSALVRLVLFIINGAARLKYTKGELGGIPSIHFAHWSVIDGGRRLLFLSNYDGSWESYLDDFIEKAASGLSAVWSNTVDFPACRWLGLRSGGARHGPPFKRMARRSQRATTVHYSAYPRLSVSNIQDNSSLRRELVGDLDDAAVKRWLLRL